MGFDAPDRRSWPPSRVRPPVPTSCARVDCPVGGLSVTNVPVRSSTPPDPLNVSTWLMVPPSGEVYRSRPPLAKTIGAGVFVSMPGSAPRDWAGAVTASVPS